MTYTILLILFEMARLYCSQRFLRKLGQFYTVLFLSASFLHTAFAFHLDRAQKTSVLVGSWS